MKRILFVLMAIVTIAIVGCNNRTDEDLTPPENKEQIRTEQDDPRDSVPPGHHPDNDDDDPYGGKYDPIWLH